MPPLEPQQLAEVYLQMLFDAGPALPGFAGPAQLTWSEIESYARQTGQHLRPTEAKLLRQLSGVYVSATGRMTKHDARSPWPEDTAETARQRGRSVFDAFGALASINKPKPKSAEGGQ